MKKAVFFVICCVLLISHGGCSLPEIKGTGSRNTSRAYIYTQYAPAKAKILPLSEIARDKKGNNYVEAYVALLDEYQNQVISPAVFRFELFEFQQRSADPTGKRIHIWPEKDLTSSTDNNEFWNDYMRAYKFSLQLPPNTSSNSVLQLTCFIPTGKRLITNLKLQY